MKNLTDIKQRIKSISQTRQITKAMETISISKMRKALAVYESNLVFFNRIRSVMSDIILHSKDVSNVFMRSREGNRSIFIVIASDKGLAGSYNNNVLVEAWKVIEKVENKYIIAIGQIAREFFQKRNIMVDIEFTYLTQDPEFADAVDIVENIVYLYKHDKVLYVGEDNRINLFGRSSSINTGFYHWYLRENWWEGDYDKVYSANGNLQTDTNGNIYFKGLDEKIHLYKFENDLWVHSILNHPNQEEAKVGGDIVIASNTGKPKEMFGTNTPSIISM